MRTQDGYLMVGAAGEAIWVRGANALSHPEWCEDPRFATNRQRMANRDALDAEINGADDEIDRARSTTMSRCSPTHTDIWQRLEPSACG